MRISLYLGNKSTNRAGDEYVHYLEHAKQGRIGGISRFEKKYFSKIRFTRVDAAECAADAHRARFRNILATGARIDIEINRYTN
jgi:hypothetical protein